MVAREEDEGGDEVMNARTSRLLLQETKDTPQAPSSALAPPQRPNAPHNASSLPTIQWPRRGGQVVWGAGHTAVSTERVRRGRCSLRATMGGNEADVTDGLHVGGPGGAERRCLRSAWDGVTGAHLHTLGASVTLGY